MTIELTVINGETYIFGKYEYGVQYGLYFDGELYIFENSDLGGLKAPIEAYEDDILVKFVKNDSIANYVTDSPSLKSPIDEETFQKLSEDFKKLYKVQKKTENVEEKVEFTVARPVENLIPDESYHLSGDEIRDLIIPKMFNRKKNAYISTHYNDGLKITILSKSFDGNQKKILDKKKNGLPYADKRGHYVDDLPKELTRYIIPFHFIPEIVGDNKEDALSKFQDIVDFVTQMEKSD